MGNVVDLNSFRNKKKGIQISESPFSHKTQTKRIIEGKLIRSVQLKSHAYLATIPSVMDREKAVVDSLNLYTDALKLADSIDCRIIRREKQNEIVFEIVDKG